MLYHPTLGPLLFSLALLILSSPFPPPPPPPVRCVAPALMPLLVSLAWPYLLSKVGHLFLLSIFIV